MSFDENSYTNPNIFKNSIDSAFVETPKTFEESLKHVKDPTPELCMAAVQQDWKALQYVKEQTPEICMAAIKQNGMALEYIKNQTPEICMVALQQSSWALKYVKTKLCKKIEKKILLLLNNNIYGLAF